MKKAPLFAIAAAALFVAGAGPAFAGDRDNVSFSFGIVVNDGGYHRGHDRNYHDDDCDDDRRHYGRRSHYDAPYWYGPPRRVVVVERGHRDWHHKRHHHRHGHHRHGHHRGHWDD